MLSILRTLPMVRTVFIALLFAVFFAGSNTCLAAQHSRAHKKPASSQPARPKARPHAAPAHTGRRPPARSASTRPSRNRASYRTNPRRRSYRRPVSVVRSRTHHRNYSSGFRTAPPAPRDIRTPESAAVAAPFVATPRSRIATTETAAVDSTSDESGTAETAADKIAAAEDPSPRPETTVSSTVASIPLHNTKIIAMAPLRGSMESLIRQNEKTDADNLERIEDDADLHNRIANGSLVPVPASGSLSINPNLPADRRYCRPWTARFLSDLARDHQAEFHHPFEVSSAVRTVEYQKRLRRTNGNAAPAEGDVASPHLTGATIDIAKSGLNRTELYWMRNRLNTLQNEGKIDVEEEFRQACFHITVYKSYVGAGPLHKPHHKAPAPPPDDADGSSDAPATGQ